MKSDSELKVTVGLETHLMLKDVRKLYCNCVPDKNICQICRGTPGSLPLNPSPISLRNGVVLAQALDAVVSKQLLIYRKHYRYYDLPCGFQRTQKPSAPFFKEGKLQLLKHPVVLKCLAYVEEDPAATKKKGVDFKRCGSPLLEVVTEPYTNYLSVVQKVVKEYLLTLKRLALDLNICRPQKVMKSDVNISVVGSPRYEVKNVGSVAGVVRAVELAIPLLVSDTSNLNKTFHLKKDRLIYSRPKQCYLFSRQWNVPKVSVEVNVPKIPTVYSVLHELNEKCPHRLNYVFVKSLVDACRNEPAELQRILRSGPSAGLKELDFRRKNSETLKSYLVTRFVELNLTKLQFDSKSRSFLDKLNLVKSQLSEKGIPFSSYTINKILEELWSE